LRGTNSCSQIVDRRVTALKLDGYRDSGDGTL
jgi:hypothetical protein